MMRRGTVVLVRFPFSDLSASKLRPAIVIAPVGRDDYVLTQVTSNPYADVHAVQLDERHFDEGSLHRTSFARPGKLFTANASIVARTAGQLTAKAAEAVLDAVIRVLRNNGS